MMKLKIVKDTNPSLREKSKEIPLPLTEDIILLAESMREYLIKSQDEKWAKKHNVRSGVGLAAPQIGKNIRMFSVYLNLENEIYDYTLVNPKIIEESSKLACLRGGEGCLSVDDEHNGLVHRHNRITIKGINAFTHEEVTLHLVGYPAIVFQHEYDHLDGKLFYDRIDKFNPDNLKPGEIEY